MRLTIRTAALAALLALGAASGVQAQAQPTGQAQDDRRGPHQMSGQMQAQMQAMREAHERQRAQDMRTILRLRPDQEPALTAFLQSRGRPGGMPKEERRGPPVETLTTPQRLDEMARRESDRSAMRQRHADALRAFYTALSPDQRQVFDALQRMHGGGPGRGGRERGGWGHRGFGGPMGGPPGGPPRD